MLDQHYLELLRSLHHWLIYSELLPNIFICFGILDSILYFDAMTTPEMDENISLSKTTTESLSIASEDI